MTPRDNECEDGIEIPRQDHRKAFGNTRLVEILSLRMCVCMRPCVYECQMLLFLSGTFYNLFIISSFSF